jgi:hypothetical protein
MEPTMAGVAFPPGILGRAVSQVPSLIDIPHPATPPGVPIPYPNVAHFENPPAASVLNVLFQPVDIDVLGIAPPTEL